MDGKGKKAGPSDGRSASFREEQALIEHLEAKLDAALEMTFPASDPIAVDTRAAGRRLERTNGRHTGFDDRENKPLRRRP